MDVAGVAIIGGSVKRFVAFMSAMCRDCEGYAIRTGPLCARTCTWHRPIRASEAALAGDLD